MTSMTRHESSSRHEHNRGASCARFFNNVAVSVGHTLDVCLIFIDVLALLRLIRLQRTEPVGCPAV